MLKYENEKIEYNLRVGCKDCGPCNKSINKKP